MGPEATAEQIRADIRALEVRDTPHLRAVRKAWSAKLKAAAAAEVIALAQALERPARQGGKWIGYELIRFHPGAFAAVGEAEVADFASRAESWYAVDALGTILAGPAWAKGRIDDGLVDGWSRADSRWLRRLSLVATVGRNGVRADAARTFALTDRLAADRDDMVEKAVSWALRFLSQKDRAAVEAHWAANAFRYGARVRREVAHKLATGLKNPRRSA